MCGIAGLWRFDGPGPADALRIAEMAALLHHRGPDDAGFLQAEARGSACSASRAPDGAFPADIRLASQRLKVTDTSAAGWQPLANETNDIFVVFNGAIYNHVELRRELQALGHRFRSHCDTEVIVHAYEAWGAACASRFNGMWAYAIWDHRRRQLVLSRDRFGVKPLYVAQRPGFLAFASEVKALQPIIERFEPDLGTIGAYLEHQRLDQGTRTFVAGVESLPAAHSLVVTDGGQQLLPYWSYPSPAQAPPPSRRAAEAGFLALLDDAVRLRLRADVPVGVLLSGGVDSSSIAALAARVGPLRAYTAVFPGFWADEERYAAAVAGRLGLPLARVAYEPGDFVADVQEATWHLDAPMLLGQVMARSRLLAAASEGVTVVLEGQGADELLAGYPERYARPYMRDLVHALSPTNALATAWELWSAADLGTRRQVKLRKAVRPRNNPARASLLSAETHTAQAGSRPATGGRQRSPYPDALRTALWRDHRQRILPHLLHFGDAMSMAHSVESRLPFLDYRLVEYVFRLGGGVRIHRGATKALLRDAVKDLLPPAVVQRRQKVGFSTPLGRWLDGSLPAIRELLLSPGARQRGVLDPAAVAQLLQPDARGARRDAALLRCLALELWFSLFIDREGFPAAGAARRPLAAAGTRV